MRQLLNGLCLLLLLATPIHTKANSIDTKSCTTVVCRLAGLELPLSAPADDAHLKRKIAEYLNHGPRSTERLLGRASAYFPVFEFYLDKHGMPSGLKYLAVAESMLVPGAVSSARAAGLWQLMPATAREMGLRVDRVVDERLDIYRSTEAAVLMLKGLYAQFGDWHLALAAYNCGPGRVRRAVRSAGGYTNYAKVRRFLPRETQNYVAAYVAAAYALTFYDDYGLTPAASSLDLAGIRTLTVYRQVSLRKLAQHTGLDYRVLRGLNPKFTAGYVPGSRRGLELRVPIEASYEVRRYIWGKDNLVELPADGAVAEAYLTARSEMFDPLSFLLGIRKESLRYYSPSVGMVAAVDRFTVSQFGEVADGALALN